MEVWREESKAPEGTGPRSKGGGWERKMFNCSILPHRWEDVRSKAPTGTMEEEPFLVLNGKGGCHLGFVWWDVG